MSPMTRLLTGAALLSLAAPVLGRGQNVWHVDVNATPPGDGSPGSPYASIQYAIDQPTTQSGDDLLVAPGTYVETLFHLRADSPFDAGRPTELDPDGSRRDIGAVPYDPSWAPGTLTYCFASAADCPCGNGGSGQGGCDLPQATGGVVIAIEDFLTNGSGGGTASIVGTGYPPASAPGVTLIRSPAVQNPPVVFGDGLRCISSAGLVRIGAVLAGGGSSLHAVNHGAGAGTFYYQLWTRSLPATYCDPAAAFNLSNGLQVSWP